MRTALVAPILIYRCGIRTSGKAATARIARLLLRCKDGQEILHAGDGQAHDVGVRPFDSGDEARRKALNRVGSRFVAPFPALDVPADIVVAERREMHGGPLDAPHFEIAAPQAAAS